MPETENEKLRETLTDPDAKDFLEMDLRAEQRMEKFYSERKSR